MNWTHVSNDKSLRWLKQCKSFQLHFPLNDHCTNYHPTLIKEAITSLWRYAQFWNLLSTESSLIGNFLLVPVTQNGQSDTLLPLVSERVRMAKVILCYPFIRAGQNGQTYTWLPLVSERVRMAKWHFVTLFPERFRMTKQTLFFF